MKAAMRTKLLEDNTNTNEMNSDKYLFQPVANIQNRKPNSSIMGIIRQANRHIVNLLKGSSGNNFSFTTAVPSISKRVMADNVMIMKQKTRNIPLFKFMMVFDCSG